MVNTTLLSLARQPSLTSPTQRSKPAIPRFPLAALLLLAHPAIAADPSPIPVKVFVAAMFEIGQNTGDRAGEFQQWYERYWTRQRAN
jgi:hypothetical protein